MVRQHQAWEGADGMSEATARGCRAVGVLVKGWVGRGGVVGVRKRSARAVRRAFDVGCAGGIPEPRRGSGTPRTGSEVFGEPVVVVSTERLLALVGLFFWGG